MRSSIQTAVLQAGRFPGLSPIMIPGCEFWIDPSDKTGSGISAGGWGISRDKSRVIAPRDVSQGTDANRPDVTTINGRSAFGFANAGDRLAVSTNGNSMYNAAPGFTIAGVARINSFAANHRLFSINSSSGAFNGMSIAVNITTGLLFVASRRLNTDTASGHTATGAFPLGAAAFFYGSMTASTGLIELQVDDVYDTQTAGWATGAATQANNATVVAHIGQNNGAGDNLVADVGDLCGYRRALTEAERRGLRRYCQWKWGTA